MFECETCKGSGYGGDGGHAYSSQEEYEGMAEHVCRQCPVPCSDCGGKGYLIPDELVDQARLELHCARSSFDKENERIQLEALHCEECEDEVRRVLDAVFDWLGFGDAETRWVCMANENFYPCQGTEDESPHRVMAGRFNCGLRVVLPPTKETT